MYGSESSDNIILVHDSYNEYLSSYFSFTINCSKDWVTIPSINSTISIVVAIGGCTALDYGRKVAFLTGKQLIVIPTILSTSCISSNTSIVYSGKSRELVKTTSPSETIILLNDILSQPDTDFFRWTSSGLGDLISNISAIIDFSYSLGINVDYSTISNLAPSSVSAINYVNSGSFTKNRKTIIKVSEMLHESSLGTVICGHTNFNAGCEHSFYESVVGNGNVKDIALTHGQLVAIGTLVTLKIYSYISGCSKLFEKIVLAFSLLNLPLTYNKISCLGLTREIMLENFISVCNDYPNSIYRYGFDKIGVDLIDDIFKQ